MNRRVVYGNQQFIEKVKRDYGIDDVIKLKGRSNKDRAGRK